MGEIRNPKLETPANQETSLGCRTDQSQQHLIVFRHGLDQQAGACHRFHLTVGFDHLYLYDNDSSDHYESVIRPFVSRAAR